MLCLIFCNDACWQLKQTREKPMTINHIAIIPDGNGRWATKNNLSKLEGHQRGAEVMMDIVKSVLKLGIKHLTIWGFSTENMKRTDEEVEGLMNIAIFYLSEKVHVLKENGIRLHVIGDRTKFAADFRDSITFAEEATAENDNLNLYLAINYGGKDEIVRACQKIAEQGLKGNEITEETISRNLDVSNMPDPDLVIRTSGEYRISNFLIWQIAYSELYFTKVLWPDFNEAELKKAIEDFDNRKRNFGYAREQIVQ